MIIALGIAYPAPEHRDELLVACQKVAKASREDEGCLEYGFHLGLENSDAITSVEVWASQASLNAHMDHAHTVDFLATVTELTDGQPKMQLFNAELISGEPFPSSRP